MAKLYFKYGVMGSSKTVQALVTRYNYEERGMRTWLIKPALDTRDDDAETGETIIRSRIGIEAVARAILPDESITTVMDRLDFKPDVIIVDEAQFLTESHVKQLRYIASYRDIVVLCYGLRTTYRGELFAGSKALFELSDSISEVKAMCDCGNKAIMNGLYTEDKSCFTLRAINSAGKIPSALKAVDIEWDVDNDEDLASLPTEIVIPDDMDTEDPDEDEISDYISDMTGWCHKGFKLVRDNAEPKILLGGNERYKGVCYRCWRDGIRLEEIYDIDS